MEMYREAAMPAICAQMASQYLPAMYPGVENLGHFGRLTLRRDGMIFERYRGSDASKAVARRLDSLAKQADTMSSEDRVKVLQELLGIEMEPNWRGYLWWRIADEHLRDERHEEAVAALFEAKGEFDPLLGTIKEVMDEYLSTLYYLMLEHYEERNDIEALADLGQIVVTNLDSSGLSDLQQGYVLLRLGHSLNMLARRHSVGILRRLALDCYLRWHHIDPEDESCLAQLAFLYFETGDLIRSRLAAEMCLEVAPAGEARDKVEVFLQEHARELGQRGGRQSGSRAWEA